MRKKIFDIIEPSTDETTKWSGIYDFTMMICIIASMIPLTVKSNCLAFVIIDKVTVTVFIIDYFLRLITSDYKLNKGGKSILLYPIQPMAIIDLLSILPSLIPINSGFKVLRLLRIIRTLKVFRSFKLFRYSKNIDRILRVIKNQSKSLGAVASMAFFYIFFTGLIMFNIEPSTFDNFFEALYWAAISLTSVGYGDIIPKTATGQFFTIISALVGVAVVALPSGIMTAGYLEELAKEKEDE